jgi:hypothetical protein
MNLKLFEKFLQKAEKKFSNKFDYSKVDYINSDSPITIICPKHGEFITTPTRFLQSKHGCRQCSIEEGHKQQRKSHEQFIIECKEVWNTKYTYEKTKYVDSKTKVIITCPIHGDFTTNPPDFLNGHGCPKCKGQKTSIFNKNTKTDTLETFIDKATLMYNNLFDYSKVIYVNSRTKILIHSNLANEDFLITPNKFLQGDVKQKYLKIPKKDIPNNLNKEIFVQRAVLIHGNKYDYSKVEYTSVRDKVCIICPEHGEFWQTPTNHLWNSEGCPICNASKGEIFVGNVLSDLNLNYVRQYKINYNNKNLYIDYCVIVNNSLVFIEYNGIQHYQPVEYFGGEQEFIKQQERDLILRTYCKENNITLFEYKYDISFSELSLKIKKDIEYAKNRL